MRENAELKRLIGELTLETSWKKRAEMVQRSSLIKEWNPVRPNELWCSDVSFIPFQGKWWYLATIVDIVTRQIITCQIGKQHNTTSFTLIKGVSLWHKLVLVF